MIRFILKPNTIPQSPSLSAVSLNLEATLRKASAVVGGSSAGSSAGDTGTNG